MASSLLSSAESQHVSGSAGPSFTDELLEKLNLRASFENHADQLMIERRLRTP